MTLWGKDAPQVRSLPLVPVRADAPARAVHVLYMPAGDAWPSAALRAWLERRGIAYEVAWLGLAVEISEAEAEALGERDDVLLLRTPFPSEPLPGLDAPPITARVWLRAVGQ